MRRPNACALAARTSARQPEGRLGPTTAVLALADLRHVYWPTANALKVPVRTALRKLERRMRRLPPTATILEARASLAITLRATQRADTTFQTRLVWQLAAFSTTLAFRVRICALRHSCTSFAFQTTFSIRLHALLSAKRLITQPTFTVLPRGCPFMAAGCTNCRQIHC